MKDIAYKDRHLPFKDGDLVLVDGKDRVIQHIITAFRIIRGDWFLDYRAGIDIFNNLKANPKLLKAEIKEAVKEVYGVQNVKDYVFNKIGDEYRVSATALIDNQEFYINEVNKL